MVSVFRTVLNHLFDIAQRRETKKAEHLQEPDQRRLVNFGLVDSRDALVQRIERTQFQVVPEGIAVIDKKITAVDGEPTVDRIIFENGETLPAKGVFVALGTAGSTDLARKVGAETENNHIKVNENMETSLPSLYAAGDCIGGTLQIYKAVSDGAAAAMTILKHLSGNSR